MNREPTRDRYDAVVVGAGPNGFAAAITLARAGCSVLVVEGADTPGGGLRTEERTLPGYRHDVCAAVLPMGLGSPFFRSLPLERLGLRWVQPPVPAAHPLDDGTAAVLGRSVEETAALLGPDRQAYRSLMGPLASRWEDLLEDVLAPLGLPKHPLGMARFGALALRSARSLAEDRFRGVRARALFGGLAAHGGLPLERRLTAAFGVVLGASAHAFGWPLVQGGSQVFADVLARHLGELGGEVVTGWPVRSANELPGARAVLFDVTAWPLVALAGQRLPSGYRRRQLRFRPGPGAFKVDWALAEPIPWRARESRQAGTLHLGGTLDQIAASERRVARGGHPRRPYTLVVQPTVFDPTRAPAGRHTAWAYCHVPNGSTFDMADRVEAQVERFAPGFRDCILGRSVMPPQVLAGHNPNCRGGDISGGAPDLRQAFWRPASALHPYRIPVPGWYLCSSSTPPGGGVHGMCGYRAARTALRERF